MERFIWNSNFFRRLTNALTVNYEYSRSNSENFRKQQSQKLLKSAEEYFYSTFSLFRANQVKSFLVTSEILGLLVNTLTAKYKYSQILKVIVRIYRYQFKGNYLKNQKRFVLFYCIFGIYIKF